MPETPQHDRILLAVSGGVDSMYLLHRAPELFRGKAFAVAHCNFSLRGEESDGDELLVRQSCTEAGITLHVKRFDTLAYAGSKGISIEMAARELRYGWFGELCREYGYGCVATAHNANDNAETLLLNLLRGTGSRGLKGIPRESVLTYGNCEVHTVRPLLDLSRKEIEAWMRENGHSWRNDSTNSSDEYKRNKIRNRVFPVFAEINPSFIRTLSEDIGRFGEAEAIADEYFKAAREQICSISDDCVSIDVPALLSYEHWRFILWRLLEGASFSAGTFEKLCALLMRYRTEPSGTVTLSGKTFESPTHLLTAKKRRLLLTAVYKTN